MKAIAYLCIYLQLVLMFTVQCNNNFYDFFDVNSWPRACKQFIVVLHLITKQKILDINYCYLYKYAFYDI